MPFLEASAKTAGIVIAICFCVAGACADICEDNPNATVTAIVGIVAFVIMIVTILAIAAITIAGFWGLV